jgi:hypothetical protein
MKQITSVSSNVMESCPFCEEACGATDDGMRYLVNRVNHLIGSHGFWLVHVGQETDTSADGELWQRTVAVLGSEVEVPEFDRSELAAELDRLLDEPPTRLDP